MGVIVEAKKRPWSGFLAGQLGQHHKPPEVLKSQVFWFWFAGGLLTKKTFVTKTMACILRHIQRPQPNYPSASQHSYAKVDLSWSGQRVLLLERRSPQILSSGEKWSIRTKSHFSREVAQRKIVCHQDAIRCK